MTIQLRTIDHPEANGRRPQRGERGYMLTFPLEDGNSLQVLAGATTFEKFQEFLGSMVLDEMQEAS